MPLPQPAWTSDPKLFAYPTVRQRWPTIVRDAADECRRAGIESVAAKLSHLLGDFESDARVTAFPEDAVARKPELRAYNESLAALGTVTWRNGPWLFLECYLYQLFDDWFLEAGRKFDVFENLKTSTFKQLSAGVLELCKRVDICCDELKKSSEDDLRLLFIEFADILLWGNATDLSLLAGNVTLQDIRSVQGAEVRKKNEDKILVNDIEAAWAHLDKKRGRVDFVLDNSGFELFADLCFSIFLLELKLATEVHLHCKEIPWFVSDTMPKDVEALVAQLEEPGFFPESAHIANFAERVRALLAAGKIKVLHHPFWTQGGNFWALPQLDLYSDLKQLSLVVFKGDLNYRKLTGDLQWDPTTPFRTAVQGLAARLPILALRTCKADVVVGLKSGEYEELARQYEAAGHDVGEFWTSSGKWAVISFLGN